LGAKKAILEIRQEMITNHILSNTHIPNISLTSLMSPELQIEFSSRLASGEQNAE
jgi:hypothetical protein